MFIKRPFFKNFQNPSQQIDQINGYMPKNDVILSRIPLIVHDSQTPVIFHQNNDNENREKWKNAR